MKMIKTFATGMAACSLMIATPVMAQDASASDEMSDAEMAEFATMMGGLITAEPLTTEQEGRLPQAARIVEKMMPEGTMAEMMGSMFDEMLGPIMDLASGPSSSTVAQGVGASAYELDLTEEQSEEVASLFDPDWKARNERQMAVMPEMMASMMNAMEPPMRKAMSELYAINFSTPELTEIEAFFSTETGATFARKSFTMASDPRVIGATMEAMPAMMGAIGGVEQKMAEATADLGPIKGFADLTPAQQSRVIALTGLSREQIEANLVTPASETIDYGEAAEGDWEE